MSWTTSEFYFYAFSFWIIQEPSFDVWSVNILEHSISSIILLGIVTVFDRTRLIMIDHILCQILFGFVNMVPDFLMHNFLWITYAIQIRYSKASWFPTLPLRYYCKEHKVAEGAVNEWDYYNWLNYLSKKKRKRRKTERKENWLHNRFD